MGLLRTARENKQDQVKIKSSLMNKWGQVKFKSQLWP